MQAPADGQVSQETALAQQITKGQAREIMQKYMPVPETALQTHCSSLVSIAVKHKQMHIQVGPEPALCLSLFPFVTTRSDILKEQNVLLSKQSSTRTQTFGMLTAQSRPHAWSYSGLYAPDSRGKHMFSVRVDAATVPALHMLPRSFWPSPVILQSSSADNESVP